MSIFRITSLIVVLMGVLDFKSCPSSVEKAGVTETQVIDFVESLKNEGKNPLENIAKLGELSSIAEKLKTIDGTNNEQILNEIDEEIDKLATTSLTVEKQKEELKAAARKYASADVKVISSNAGSVPVLESEVTKTETKEIDEEKEKGTSPSEPPAEVVAQKEQVVILPGVVPQGIGIELSDTDVEKKSTTDDAPAKLEASLVEQASLTSGTKEGMSPDQMVERAFSDAEATKNAALQAFKKIKSASQKLQDLISSNDITSSDNINSLLEIITNAMQEDAMGELGSIINDLDDYMNKKFGVDEANEYDAYKDEESTKQKLGKMDSFYSDVGAIGNDINEELDNLLTATGDKIASAVSEDDESIEMLEHIEEVIRTIY